MINKLFGVDFAPSLLGKLSLNVRRDATISDHHALHLKKLSDGDLVAVFTIKPVMLQGDHLKVEKLLGATSALTIAVDRPDVLIVTSNYH